MMTPEQKKLLEGVDDEHLPEVVVEARAGKSLDSQEQKEVDDFCVSFAKAKAAQGA